MSVGDDRRSSGQFLTSNFKNAINRPPTPTKTSHLWQTIIVAINLRRDNFRPSSRRRDEKRPTFAGRGLVGQREEDRSWVTCAVRLHNIEISLNTHAAPHAATVMIDGKRRSWKYGASYGMTFLGKSLLVISIFYFFPLSFTDDLPVVTADWTLKSQRRHRK